MRLAHQHPEECPFLVPVTADRLWLHPVSVYCRRPEGRPRVPAPTSLACVCMTHAHLVCPGYLAGLHGSASASRPAR